MKLRIRCMPNDQWIVEGRRFFQRQWRAVGFFKADSRTSIERGRQTMSISLYSPGDSHYATCWHETRDQAVTTYNTASSLLGNDRSTKE